MKKKIRYKYFGWAIFSLIISFGFHLLSQSFVVGNGLKFLALAAFFINVASALNINIPYITDKKKLPKNYNIYAFTITVVVGTLLLIIFA